MAKATRTWRLGIDVGGTNTDAVIIDGDLKLVAATKSPTTEDVRGGIKAAIALPSGSASMSRGLTTSTPCPPAAAIWSFLSIFSSMS